MDTKLKADIAESAVVTELLNRGFNVLRPVGDRLAYDLAIDIKGRLVRIQVKHAWFNEKDKAYMVDARRTKTNRRQMLRKKSSDEDFDFAVVYLGNKKLFYIIPAAIFNSFASTITFVEESKRQRLPKTAEYRERWDLLSEENLTDKDWQKIEKLLPKKEEAFTYVDADAAKAFPNRMVPGI